MRFYDISLTHVRQDYLVKYCLWLSELQVHNTCDKVRQDMLALTRDERFAYRAYFTEQKIEQYLAAKKKQRVPESYADIKTLEDTPQTVVVLYDFLETLQAFSRTFKEIESIDIHDKSTTVNILIQALLALHHHFPIIYERLHSLNHSHSGVQTLLSPLLKKLQWTFQQARQYQQTIMATQEHIIQENQETLQRLLPEQQGGLAFLSRATILSSFLLKELTELIERGDTKIDFDPQSPDILTLEKRFNLQLDDIQNASIWTSIGPMGSLARLLCEEISKILNESIPLTKTAHEKAQAAFEHLQNHTLALLHIEVEQLEETLGLHANTLTPSFDKAVQGLLQSLKKRLDQLEKLPEKTHELAALSDSPIQSLTTSAFKSVASKIYQVRHLIPTLSNTSVATETTSSDAVPPDSIIPLTPIYCKTVLSAQLKRHAILQENTHDQTLEASALEFFDILTRYNRPFATKQIQHLPETAKLALKKAYLPIQSYFAQTYPKLDIDIVHALNTSHEAPLYPKESDSILDRKLLNSVSQTCQNWAMMLAPTFMSIDWSSHIPSAITVGIMATAVASIYMMQQYQHDNQLQHILNCQTQLLINIRQKKANDHVKQTLIEKRLAQHLQRHGDELSQYLQQLPEYQDMIHLAQETLRTEQQTQQSLWSIPLTALGEQLEYKTLFGKLKSLRLSKAVFEFETHTLYPELYQMLNEEDIAELFGTVEDRQQLSPRLPFTTFHENESHTVAYKKLLNAFYRLRTCLASLEKVDDLGEPGSWNVYGQSVVTLNTVMPLLTDGLSACFDLKDALTNPILSTITRQGLSCVEELDSLFPMLNIASLLPAPAPVTPKAPFHAKEVWLREQKHYQSLINKTIPQEILLPVTASTSHALPNQSTEFATTISMPSSEAAVFAEPAAGDGQNISVRNNSLTVDVLVTQLIESAHRFNNVHSHLAHAQALQNDASLHQQAIESVNIFFGTLQSRLHQFIYKNQTDKQNKSAELIEQLRTFCLEAEVTSTPSQSSNTWQLFDDFKDTLALIDKIYFILEETHHTATPDMMMQIQFIYDVISFKLLSKIDDLEFHLGMKSGYLSHQVMSYLDHIFTTIIHQYTGNSSYLIDFWTNNTLMQLREAHALSQAQHLHREAYDTHENIPDDVQRIFNHLDILYKIFPQKSQDLALIPEFDQFLAHYEILQSVLYACDRSFDQSSFLQKLYNFRPDRVRAAIAQISQTKPLVAAYYRAQKDNKYKQYTRRQEQYLHIQHAQSEHRQHVAVKQFIHHCLKDRYADDLGEYLPLLQQIFTKDIYDALQDSYENIQVAAYLADTNIWGQPISHEEAVDGFQQVLTTFIDKLLEEKQNTWGQILKTLSMLQRFDTQFDAQITHAWNHTLHEKSEYAFALVPSISPFLPTHNRIYLEEEQGTIYYTVIDPENKIIRAPLTSQFIIDNKIDLTQGLTASVIETQFSPKLPAFLQETQKQGHTDFKNPCLLEKMRYLQGLHTSLHRSTLIAKKLDEMPDKQDPEAYTQLYEREIKETVVFLTYRARKIKKYDQLIEAFDALNTLEAHYLQQNADRDKNKINTIKMLKNMLKNEHMTIQQRLNRLSIELVNKHTHHVLTQERHDSSFAALLSPGMRGQSLEKELLNRLYSPRWAGIDILVLLNQMEDALVQNDLEPGSWQAKKLDIILSLKNILTDPQKPEDVRLYEFFDHLVIRGSMNIFMQNQPNSSHMFESLLSLFTGYKNHEETLIHHICQPMSVFFEVALLLNQLETYAIQQSAHEKLAEIQRLKTIMEGSDSQKARLQHLFQELDTPRCQNILSTPKDTYFTHMLKQLFSYLTGWIDEEEQVIDRLKCQANFFKVKPNKPSFADTVMAARKTMSQHTSFR